MEIRAHPFIAFVLDIEAQFYIKGSISNILHLRNQLLKFTPLVLKLFRTLGAEVEIYKFEFKRQEIKHCVWILLSSQAPHKHHHTSHLNFAKMSKDGEIKNKLKKQPIPSKLTEAGTVQLLNAHKSILWSERITHNWDLCGWMAGINFCNGGFGIKSTISLQNQEMEAHF